jgi:hypothetical protein
VSDYVPCDGCFNEATHHLCEECCNEPTDHETAIAEGRRLERAAIVAFLRAEVARSFSGSLRRQVLTAVLTDIERGEHEEAT